MALKKIQLNLFGCAIAVVGALFLNPNFVSSASLDFSVSPARLTLPAIKPGMHFDTSVTINRQTATEKNIFTLHPSLQPTSEAMVIQTKNTVTLPADQSFAVVPISISVISNAPTGVYHGAINITELSENNSTSTGVNLVNTIGHLIPFDITVVSLDVVHVSIVAVTEQNGISHANASTTQSRIIVSGTVINDGTLPIIINSAVLSLSPTHQEPHETELDNTILTIPPLTTKNIQWTFYGFARPGSRVGNIKIFSSSQAKPLWNNDLFLRLSPSAEDIIVPTLNNSEPPNNEQRTLVGLSIASVIIALLVFTIFQLKKQKTL